MQDVMFALMGVIFLAAMGFILLLLCVGVITSEFPDATERLRRKIEQKLMTWLGDV